MKKLLIIITVTILLTGCINNKAPLLIDEPIDTFDVTQATDAVPKATDAPMSPDTTSQDVQKTNENTPLSLDEKLAFIDFYMISGFYSRNVTQDDMKFIEMFVLDKNNFIRVASSDLEQEVYAYNYVSDDFTYIYYFDNEMMSKTIINVGTGAILQDDEGYAELLIVDAEEIKVYFQDLMESASLSSDDL